MSHDEADLVRRRARRLSALLRETDPPVPPMAFPAQRIARAVRHRALVRWRFAAAVVLIAVAALGVRPVRAWIVEAARVLWSTATRGVARRAASAPAPRPATAFGTAGAVTFTPTAGVFVLRVAGRQAGGTLTVETTANGSASAAVTGDGGAAELVVLPEGLRIVNDRASSAGFVVRLPAALARIEVRVGRDAPRVFVPSAPGERWVMDLRAEP